MEHAASLATLHSLFPFADKDELSAALADAGGDPDEAANLLLESMNRPVGGESSRTGHHGDNLLTANLLAREGHAANEAGDYAEAWRLFEEASRLCPETERARACFLTSAANMCVKMGECQAHYRQAHYRQAEAHYRQALALPAIDAKIRHVCEKKLTDLALASKPSEVPVEATGDCGPGAHAVSPLRPTLGQGAATMGRGPAQVDEAPINAATIAMAATRDALPVFKTASATAFDVSQTGTQFGFQVGEALASKWQEASIAGISEAAAAHSRGDVSTSVAVGLGALAVGGAIGATWTRFGLWVGKHATRVSLDVGRASTEAALEGTGSLLEACASSHL